MQMWEGEIGGGSREKCPHYVHGIHTRAVQNTWDTDWGGQGIWKKWVLDGTQRNEEKPVHQQEETVALPASEGGRGGGVRGGEFGDLGERGRGWTGSDNMQEQNLKCNHHWKNYESLYLETNKRKEKKEERNEKERGILGFLWKYLKCLQTGLPLRAFFFLLNIG